MAVKIRGTGNAANPSITGDDDDTGLVYGTNQIDFSTGGTTRATVDSAGRLGLGVTPTDFHSNNTAVFQLKDGNSIFSRTGGQFLGIFQNIKYNSSDVSQYVANGLGTAYFQASGEHKFYTAASGTADNNATLQQRVRIESDGNLKILDGDLVIGASGHGIDFSDTSDASGKSSELLDDYEEGTWTPTLTCASGTITVGNHFHSEYTKVGRVVYVTSRITVSAVSSPSGWLTIQGLPFTSGSFGALSLTTTGLLDTDAKIPQGVVEYNNTFAYLRTFADGIESDNLAGYVQNGTAFIISACYNV
tara:strand:- start:529 stop:1440 length:912 start_codon:yes stop_codon:yes gene_type:complete